MLKVLIWVVSNDYRFLNGAINILDSQHDGIEVTSTVRGTNFAKIDIEDCDAILVVGAKQIGMGRIVQVARQLRLPEEKLLGDWIVTIPGFTLKKYRQLQRSRLSIFSVNCFGGMISNLLGLPFRSPFVNLFLSSSDFLKFLRAPRIYLEERLFYKCQKLNSTKTIEFPVATLGNISINMMHYKTFEESVEMWERRKPRINWYNIFAVMWTENQEDLKKFDELPYGKKICFAPFKSDLNSTWYINPNVNKHERRFVDKFNQFGMGNPLYYDLFDMLLYGKKTQLIDM